MILEIERCLDFWAKNYQLDPLVHLFVKKRDSHYINCLPQLLISVEQPVPYSRNSDGRISRHPTTAI